MLFLNFLLSMSMCMVGEHYEGVAYSLTRIDERARVKGISDSTSWIGIGLGRRKASGYCVLQSSKQQVTYKVHNGIITFVVFNGNSVRLDLTQIL